MGAGVCAHAQADTVRAHHSKDTGQESTPDKQTCTRYTGSGLQQPHAQTHQHTHRHTHTHTHTHTRTTSMRNNTLKTQAAASAEPSGDGCSWSSAASDRVRVSAVEGVRAAACVFKKRACACVSCVRVRARPTPIYLHTGRIHAPRVPPPPSPTRVPRALPGLAQLWAPPTQSTGPRRGRARWRYPRC